jgi:hypothetical protein
VKAAAVNRPSRLRAMASQGSTMLAYVVAFILSSRQSAWRPEWIAYARTHRVYEAMLKS